MSLERMSTVRRVSDERTLGEFNEAEIRAAGARPAAAR
jgi:hypothetical protein